MCSSFANGVIMMPGLIVDPRAALAHRTASAITPNELPALCGNFLDCFRLNRYDNGDGHRPADGHSARLSKAGVYGDRARASLALSRSAARQDNSDRSHH